MLASIQITRSSAKGSLSLPQLVALVLTQANNAAPKTAELVRFRLRQLGWQDEDASAYETGYQLRSPMAAIPVDNTFPAIVPDTLSSLGSAQARVVDVKYSISLNGLGVTYGSRQFDRLLFRG